MTYRYQERANDRFLQITKNPAVIEDVVVVGRIYFVANSLERKSLESTIDRT